MKTVIACALLACFAGCSYPVSKTSTVNDDPVLLFKNLPDHAAIVIDGRTVPLAQEQSAKKIQAIRVNSGTHHIQIKTATHLLFDQKVFVSEGLEKTVFEGQ